MARNPLKGTGVVGVGAGTLFFHGSVWIACASPTSSGWWVMRVLRLGLFLFWLNIPFLFLDPISCRLPHIHICERAWSKTHTDGLAGWGWLCVLPLLSYWTQFPYGV